MHSNIRLVIFILSWAVVAIFSLLWSAIGRISLINKHFCKRKQKEVRRTTGSLGYLFLRYCRDTLRTRRVAIQGGRASTQLAAWAWRTNDREVSRPCCKVRHFRAIAMVSETDPLLNGSNPQIMFLQKQNAKASIPNPGAINYDVVQGIWNPESLCHFVENMPIAGNLVGHNNDTNPIMDINWELCLKWSSCVGLDWRFFQLIVTLKIWWR